VLPPPDAQPAEASPPAEGSKEQAKAERKAAKKAAAAERALERQKAAQEKAAAKAIEKARIAQEKAVEKEKLAKEREEREKSIREKAEMERMEKERQAREKAAKEETERVVILEKERQALAEKTQTEKARAAQVKAQKAAKSVLAVKATKSAGSSGQVPTTPIAKQSSAPSKSSEPAEQAPILSKMPKKNKPITRPIKIPKEDVIALGDASAAPSISVSEAVNFPPPPKTTNTVVSSSNNSRAQSVDTSSPVEPTSLADLLDDIDVRNPSMNLPNHPFFDIAKINPAAKMPLEYGPLVHALSALSVGGGSFATNMPSGSIDNAVSSFQQLLETLTQTISDLLRLLPRTTWDDSSSFDGVLRDMLKGDDFLDDGGDDTAGKEDEVAALTLALERRARWMEVQLSKLEELHRDINTAAVRAVLAFNDSGWDRHIFMPRVGNTLRRFDNIGMVEQSGKMRPMTVDELEKKLQVAKEAAIFAETEFREAMEKMQAVKPVEVDDF
jgi:CCR4-NOT transcription complex subunit 4